MLIWKKQPTTYVFYYFVILSHNWRLFMFSMIKSGAFRWKRTCSIWTNVVCVRVDCMPAWYFQLLPRLLSILFWKPVVKVPINIRMLYLLRSLSLAVFLLRETNTNVTVQLIGIHYAPSAAKKKTICLYAQ